MPTNKLTHDLSRHERQVLDIVYREYTENKKCCYFSILT